MNDLLKVAEHPTYGKMRHIFKNGEVLFSGTDVIRALGFSNKAIITDCVDEEDRLDVTLVEAATSRSVKETLVNMFGVQSLITACKNATNTKPFKSWLINTISSKYYIENSDSIYTTRDYNMFKYLEGNRDTLQNRVNKIKSSINKVGYITNPVIVNEKHEIVDGQGRVEALKQLGLPVDYIVVKGVGAKECISLNINNTIWNLGDYVKSYAERGNTNYKRLYSLMNEYPDINIREISSALLEKNVSNDCIRDGSLILTQETYDSNKKILDYLNQFIPCIKKKKKAKKHSLLPILTFCYWCNDIDNNRLIEKFNEKFPFADNPSTLSEAISVIEEIYNKSNRNKVYLSHLFNTASNKVNPNKE